MREVERDERLEEMTKELSGILRETGAVPLDGGFAELYQGRLFAKRCPTCREKPYFLSIRASKMVRWKNRTFIYVVRACLCPDKKVEEIPVNETPLAPKCLRAIPLPMQ